MSFFHRKRGKADRDVFGSFVFRCAVLDPFAGMGDDGLASVDIDHSVAMRDPDCPLDDKSEFFERRSLARFNPTSRALKKCEADLMMA